MAGPTDLNIDAPMDVRSYGRRRSNADLIAAEDASLGRADALAGGAFSEYAPARDYYIENLGGLPTTSLGVDEDLGWIRSEIAGGGQLYGSDISPMARATSRQARIAAANRPIENAPQELAQRRMADEQAAAQMDLVAQAKQEEQASHVEALANAKAAEIVESQNRVIAAQQEQRALLTGQPIQTNPTFSKGRPQTAENVASKVDLKGSYTQDGATYTSPSEGYDIGTLDLRADAPPPRAPLSNEGVRQMALQATEAGNLDAARALGQIHASLVDAEQSKASTEKTKVDTAKSIAETEKLLSEVDENGVEGVSVDRMLTSRNQSAQRIHTAANSMVSSRMSTDPALMQLQGDERKAAEKREYATAMTTLRELPVYSGDFRILDMADSMLNETDTGKATPAKANPALVDGFNLAPKAQ